jgi:DNA integrity scanning protein DisA with diadenylate cyclase activity
VRRSARLPHQTAASHTEPSLSTERDGHFDGSFVVSFTGTVVSACRHFEAILPRGNQRFGLGTRQIAAASISSVTGAIAVVVSERSVVRTYAEGNQ